MYFIGIDGGGSSSRLVAVDGEMRVIGRCEGGPTNIVSNAYSVVLENIKGLLEGFYAAAGKSLADCGCICIGTAGAGRPEYAGRIERIFRDIGYGGKLKVTTDGELVLAAETQGEPGIIVISGTGSVAYALDKSGGVLRAGGWGHIIDDGGSGYRIGMDAVKAALMDFDGRGERTALTGLIVRHFGLNSIDGVLELVYAKDFCKTKAARLAPLVERACGDGDRVAAAIQDMAGADLAALAAALIRKTGMDEHKIVLSGSVILKNSYLLNHFGDIIRRCYPKMQIVPRSVEPEMGAVFLAVKN